MDPSVAFSAREESESISLFDWHRRMGHRTMKTIIEMAEGTVTRMTLKDIPRDTPRAEQLSLMET